MGMTDLQFKSLRRKDLKEYRRLLALAKEDDKVNPGLEELVNKAQDDLET